MAGSSYSRADAPPAPPVETTKVTTAWINSDGSIVDLPGKVISRWVWDNSPELGVPSLRLRNWLELPANYTLIKWTAATNKQNSAPSSVVQGPRDSPPDIERERTLAVDINVQTAIATLTFKTAEQKSLSIGLVISVARSTLVTSVHRSCRNEGIRLDWVKSNTPHFYTGIYCRADENFIDLYVHFSKDAKLSRSTLALVADAHDTKPSSGIGWRKLRFRRRDIAPGTETVLGRIYIQEPEGLIEHIVVYSVKANEPRWNFSVGLGTTYLWYQEDPGAIRVQEIALTPKINASYHLIPGKIDLAANAFVNLTSLGSWPAGSTSMRGYGLNGRAGWILPSRFGGAEWGLYFGWYLWNIMASDNSFGITMLAGPQMFLTMRKTSSPSRSYFLYLKYSPILNEEQKIILGNREIAVGGGYLLPWAPMNRKLTTTLDLSTLSYSSTSLDNIVQLMTATFGVQTSF